MKDRDAELREEIETHLRMAAADRVARGRDPRDAAADARRELGNISQIQEATRDVWGRRWLERVAQDVRYALRIFRRNPGFASVAILSLALGIGANTALFQVLDAVRLRALPVADPSTLVEVRIVDMDGARGFFETWNPTVTQPIWRAIESRQQAFSGIIAWGSDTFNLATGGEIRPARALWVSGDFFSMLGLTPALGRTLGADDNRPGCAPRAVLSHGFWQRAYGGDPSVVGRTLTLNMRAVEIVGVAPAGFHGLEIGRSFDAAMPLCAEPAFSSDGKGRLESGTTWWLSIFGRLKPGWTPARATAQLSAISADVFRSSLPASYPSASVSQYLGFKLAAHPAGSGVSQLRENYASPLWLLLGIAGLVLAIACANLANLLLARATARQREFAVRLGLGASRGRVIRQLVTEGLVLAAFATIGALLLANTLSGALVAFLGSSNSAIILSVGLGWRAAGFAVALAIATSLLFSLAPALKGTRIGATAVMRASARGTTAHRDAVGMRRALVVAQVALSVVLLFGSLLFARSLRNLVTTDPGFDPRGVVVAAVDFRRLDLPADRLAGFRQELIGRARAIPGIQAAAAVRIVPISGSAQGSTVWPQGDRTRQGPTAINTVGQGFFGALRIPFVAGRDFDDRDSADAAPVAIVDETFAATHFKGQAVIGALFTREATPSSPEKTYQIVGLVKNSKYMELKEDPTPVVFLPDAQVRPGALVRVALRSSLPADAVTASVTSLLASLDSRIAVSYSVLEADIRDTLIRERLLAVLSGGFGGLAALLTVVGLYGLVAYTVTRRTNEIGVRMALGATSSDIARLMVRETGVLLAVGLIAGIVLALLGGSTASTLLFGIRPNDPATLLMAVGSLSVIAFAATYAPARRATRIEPVSALRAD